MVAQPLLFNAVIDGGDYPRAILALDEFSEVWVITQNVDGFDVDMGSSNAIELYSNLSDLFCSQYDARLSVSHYAEITALLSYDRYDGRFSVYLRIHCLRISSGRYYGRNKSG